MGIESKFGLLFVAKGRMLLEISLKKDSHTVVNVALVQDNKPVYSFSMNMFSVGEKI